MSMNELESVMVLQFQLIFIDIIQTERKSTTVGKKSVLIDLDFYTLLESA